MTITNQTNKVGTVYNSKISPIRVPQLDGGLFGKKKTVYTSLRVRKVSNLPGPNQYKTEIIQHSDAVSSKTTLVGEVSPSGLVKFNDNVDFGNADERTFEAAIGSQVKNQKKDVEKQIKDKVNSDSESLFFSAEAVKKGLDDSFENGLGSKPVDELKELQKSKDAIAGTRRTRNTYGTMFYPSFIEKSVQDKLKITILEFSPKKERQALLTKTKKVQTRGSGFIYEGSLMDKFTGISDALGTKQYKATPNRSTPDPSAIIY